MTHQREIINGCNAPLNLTLKIWMQAWQIRGISVCQNGFHQNENIREHLGVCGGMLDNRCTRSCSWLGGLSGETAATCEQQLLSHYFFFFFLHTCSHSQLCHCVPQRTSNTKLQIILHNRKKRVTQEISIIHSLKQIMGCGSDKPKTALREQTQEDYSQLQRAVWSLSLRGQNIIH